LADLGILGLLVCEEGWVLLAPMEERVYEVLLVVVVHLGPPDSLEILDLQVGLVPVVQAAGKVLEALWVLLGLLVLEVHLVGQATSVSKDCQALVEGQGSLELLD